MKSPSFLLASSFALAALLTPALAAAQGLDDTGMPSERPTPAPSPVPAGEEVTPSAAPPATEGPRKVVIGLDVAPERDRLGWAVPDYVRLQTGGFIGMATVGTGYSIWRDRINVGVSYGYTPPLNGAPAAHLATATATFRPARIAIGPSELFYWYPLYAGGGALLAASKSTFVQQPAVYPKGYYPPNALHALVLLGTELAIREREGRLLLRHSIFAEVVTINQYLDALIQNKEFTLVQAFSTAVGYRASF